MTELTEQDRAILAFEQQWWRYAGAKETAVLERFGMSGTRYYQRLAWIIEQPEAVAVEPMVVRRLVRLRDARRRVRRVAPSSSVTQPRVGTPYPQRSI